MVGDGFYPSTPRSSPLKSTLLLALSVLLLLGMALLGAGAVDLSSLAGTAGSAGDVVPFPTGASGTSTMEGGSVAPAVVPGLQPLQARAAGQATGRETAPLALETMGWAELQVRAVDSVSREPVEELSVRRASLAGDRFHGDIECTAEAGSGDYLLRWQGPANVDFQLIAPGYLRASLNATVARASEGAALVELVRPSELIVHVQGFTATELGNVDVYLGKDARRGAPIERHAWKGESPIVFDGLRPGNVSVVVTVPGCPPGSVHGIPLVAGDTAQVTVSAPPGQVVQGVILEASSGEPMEAVRVRVRPEVSGLSASDERAPFPAVLSGRTGRFTVEGVPVGRAVITLEGPGGARVDRKVVVIDGNASREHRLRMAGAGTLSGRVAGKGAFGEGQGVLIVAKGDAKSIMGSLLKASSNLAKARGTFAPLGPDGSFIAESVPAGRQLLVVHRAEAGTISFVEVRDPLKVGESRTGVELSLLEAPRRSFRVIDTGGRAVESIEVAFEERLAGAAGWSRWVELASVSGDYACDGLAPSARRVRVRREGYASAVARWRDGESPTIELRKARHVPFVVAGTHGRALRGVRLRAESVPQGASQPETKPRVHLRRATTDRYGWAGIELDPAFTWSVTTLLPGYETGGPVLVARDDGGEGAAPFRIVMDEKVEPEPATVRGQIVRAGSGGPIFDLDFVGLRGGTFWVDGADFELRGLPPGKLAIAAQSAGFETVQLPVESLRPGETLDVGVIPVRPATLLEVTVKDSTGKRARGVKVTLHRLPPSKGGRADLPNRIRIPEANGARGVYRRSGVGRAKWRLVAQQGRNHSVSRIVTLSGARKGIQIQLAERK